MAYYNSLYTNANDYVSLTGVKMALRSVGFIGEFGAPDVRLESSPGVGTPDGARRKKKM